MAGEEGECPVSVTPGLQRSEPGQGREPGPGEEGRGLVAVGHVSSQLRAQSESVGPNDNFPYGACTGCVPDDNSPV